MRVVRNSCGDVGRSTRPRNAERSFSKVIDGVKDVSGLVGILESSQNAVEGVRR